MNLKEKQELLAAFLIQHCNIDYDSRCVPIGIAHCLAEGNSYLGHGCWKYALQLIYVDQNGSYASTGELCTFDVNENYESIVTSISVALDEIKDYYATNHRKFKNLSWQKLKSIVENEKPTNINIKK